MQKHIYCTIVETAFEIIMNVVVCVTRGVCFAQQEVGACNVDAVIFATHTAHFCVGQCFRHGAAIE